MKNPPTATEQGVSFDLETVSNELRADESYRHEGHTARTLIRTPDARIIVVALATGKTLSEHQANGAAAVQTLSGRIRLQLPDRGVEVPAGQLLVMGAGLSHDVYAEADSIFLL